MTKDMARKLPSAPSIEPKIFTGTDEIDHGGVFRKLSKLIFKRQC
jgi:hypothetical protein